MRIVPPAESVYGIVMQQCCPFQQSSSEFRLLNGGNEIGIADRPTYNLSLPKRLSSKIW